MRERTTVPRPWRTLFDDESDGSATLLPHSRAVAVKLDLRPG